MANTVLIASTPATAAEALRQGVVDVSGATELFVEVLFSHNAATELEIVPEFSTDSQYYMRLTSRDIYNGVGNLDLYSDKIAVSQNINFVARYDVTVATSVRLTINTTSGGANDRFIVRVATT